MKWTLLSNPSSTVQVFNLIEENMVKEIVRYNPLQQSARITCRNEQRLFFVEKAGFNNHHFNFKNEYGFAIGRLSVEEPDTEGGSIEIGEKKFHYRQLASPSTELVIYEHDHIQPLVTCSFIKNTEASNPFSHTNKKSIHQYASLLLALCWYFVKASVGEDNIAQKPSLLFI